MLARVSQSGLPQYLNYSRFIAPGIIELQDGALQTSFEYSGPDQEYEEFGRMASFADQLNIVLAKLGDGWMLESNSVRVPVSLPPALNFCPDPTSALIAAERGQRYAAEGLHYETRHILTLTYLPPGNVQRQFSEYFFVGRGISKKESRAELLRRFHGDTEQLAEALSHILTIRRLEDDEVLHFLRLCVTGEDRAVGLPLQRDYLAFAIGSTPLSPHGGQTGVLHTRVIGVYGFPEDGTSPQMFAGVLNLPFALRMSQRFIFLSTETAVKDLGNKRADFLQLNAYNPKRIIWSIFKNIMQTDPNDREVVAHNTDAEMQKESVEREIAALQGGRIRGGYYTFTVVVHGATAEEAQTHALEVMSAINVLGFSAHVETDNAADALGGSWPGHGTRNVRKPRLNTRHFAQLWPTSTTWRGEKSHPCSYYPAGSGPLLTTTTTGSTPFFFNTHVMSLGNFLIIGPSGNGKTFLLNAMAIAHRQYPRAQINFFDRDAGAVVPTLACGGEFFDLDAMHYAPLAHIDEEEERVWAAEFCERLAILRDCPMTPLGRVDIMKALIALSTAPQSHRTMTNFLSQLQTHEAGLKEALSFYTLGNGGALLDGEYTPTQENSWRVFDMEKLLARGKSVSTPVLDYQFHMMGRLLDGRPTITLCDEAWMTAVDSLFREFIEESSATNRKKVCSLGLVLHSPGNLATFPRADMLLANIATIIFLPNDKAEDAALKPHYQALGLNDRQIALLATATPQRDYLCKQGKNIRLFQLQSGPMERAFLSANGRDHRARVLTLRDDVGARWPQAWLQEQGHAALADQWHQEYERKEQQRAA